MSTLIEIRKIASKSDYRTHDYAVKNDGTTIFTTGSRLEAEVVALWAANEGQRA